MIYRVRSLSKYIGELMFSFWSYVLVSLRLVVDNNIYVMKEVTFSDVERREAR